MRLLRQSVGISAIIVCLIGCGGNSDSVPVLTQAPVYGGLAEGYQDGPASVAQFANPANVQVGPDGSVYVADYDNNAVRVIAPNGIVSTVVKQANFIQPFGLTFSPDGYLYVSTDWNDQGVKNATSGTIWRINVKNKTAIVLQRNLGRPRGLLAVSKTQLVLADLIHDTISLMDTNSKVVTIIAGVTDATGHVNGQGSDARFNRPYGMARLSDGSVLVCDANNNCIRRVTLNGDVTDFAGSTAPGFQNGPVAEASFLNPEAVTVSNNNVYVADTGNHVIRRISANTVSTEAGNGMAGFALGSGTTAEFYGLEGISILPGWSTLWVADGNEGDGSNHNHVRKISVP